MRPSLLLRGALAAGVGFVLLAPLVANAFTITLMNYIGIGAIVALGLVLLTGIGGLTSFGQAAFMGIGAYATAWATTSGGASTWAGLLLALAATGVAALLIGAITLRLGGHFLPLSTIAWGIAIYSLFANIPGLGQHDGIANIPPISIAGFSLAANEAIYYLIWAILGLAMLLVTNLLDSREGRAVRSLRGGQTMLGSLGVSLFRQRLIIFVIAALLAAVAGWLYAHMSRFVSPSPFEVRPGIEYLLMALTGGAMSVWGAVIGATLITLLKNAIQDILPYLSSSAGQLEVVAFSVLLILILQFARGGVMSLVRRFRPPSAAAPVAAAAERLPRRPQPQAGSDLLRVDNVTRHFGGLVAVDAVGFSMRAGDILALIGPNGAGKSTLFNLITGVLATDAGSITFMGRSITGLPPHRIAAAGLGRTFQHVKLRPAMTVLDNVLLGTYLRTRSGFLGGILRLDRREEAQAVAEAMAQLARVGLAAKAADLAGNLSLGHQRVLEVARALASDPALIILDEPAAGLRRPEKEALAALLRQLRQEGLSILLVEHDMDFVMGLVDRIVVMEFGSKLMEGTPQEVRASPRVQEAYLGGVA
ncbi:MAG: branched-chain amino acid ABC transporter ATP-binding protein/permease [Hyphomicrobiaceae bacterium]|nr:branched-chain amino acid ABC transporter ATP-binding protein/permease [Hyphomicrobiaceae bacterium]